jgi:hypothetical protein
MGRRDGAATQVTLSPWTNHDQLRLVRSGLSQLRVPFGVVSGTQAGAAFAGVYAVHEYADEKREALVMG